MIHEIEEEDNADVMVCKIIQDVFWITPDWFTNNLEERFGDNKIPEMLDYKHVTPPISLGPNHLVIWGAMSYEDNYLYPRTLGMIARMCYYFLHPVSMYVIQNNLIEGGLSPLLLQNIQAKYEYDLAENTNLLCAKRTEFDDYSLEFLTKLCASTQAVSGGLGEVIFKQYEEGTSFVLDVAPTVAYYNNVVNLTSYCWLMTMNEQVRSINKEELRMDESFRVIFSQPLHKKGSSALCRLMDSIRNKFRRSPNK